MLNWIRCLVGKHRKVDTFVANFTSDNGIVATIAWEQCSKCGWSKIKFIYG